MEHPDQQRLQWINLVLVHASNQQCPFVPVPLESNSGSRLISHSGFLWELAPWMPGIASFDQDPNDARLRHAMQSLAQFHLASAQVNLGFKQSENVATRHASLLETPRSLAKIANASIGPGEDSIARLQKLILGLGENHAMQLARGLEPFLQTLFPVQPVIRDVWHDHLLFTGDELTGLVDFGAMQIDNVALDLARVLGSLIGNPTERWHTAIESYSTIRPCSSVERELVFALDQSAAYLGSLNWLKWILLDRRSFESKIQVEKRLKSLIKRLNHHPIA